MMGDNNLLGRSIKIETAVRCDFCHRQIEKGKYGTMVNAEGSVAQGLYHGRLCYESALADYQQKVKELELGEEANE